MSRKDFTVLAEELSKINCLRERTRAAVAVAAACAKINFRFDIVKFYKACGL
jgi:hypothetical protein